MPLSLPLSRNYLLSLYMLMVVGPTSCSFMRRVSSLLLPTLILSPMTLSPLPHALPIHAPMCFRLILNRRSREIRIPIRIRIRVCEWNLCPKSTSSLSLYKKEKRVRGLRLRICMVLGIEKTRPFSNTIIRRINLVHFDQYFYYNF